VGAFDAESLVYPWGNADGRVDLLSETVQAIAAEGDRKKESRRRGIFTDLGGGAFGCESFGAGVAVARRTRCAFLERALVLLCGAYEGSVGGYWWVAAAQGGENVMAADGFV